jgi:hypothetical protein
LTTREIAEALIADKDVPASRKRFVDLQAAIQTAFRKRAGGAVPGQSKNPSGKISKR